MRKLLLVLLISFAACFSGCNLIKGITNKKRAVAKSYLSNALYSSVAVMHSNRRGLHSHGTGVYLDTGYVITAAHIVDWNVDGTVTPKEMKQKIYVRFYGDSVAKIHTATVVRAGEWRLVPKEDVAILKITDPPKNKGVSLASNKEIRRLLIGEEIFTFGRTKGSNMHLSLGVVSTSHREKLRITANAYFGNSGGGVFRKDNQKLIGLVTGIVGHNRTSRSKIVIPRFNDKGKVVGLMVGNVFTRYKYFIPGWTGCVSAKDIRVFAMNNGLRYTVDKHIVKKKSPYFSER